MVPLVISRLLAIPSLIAAAILLVIAVFWGKEYWADQFGLKSKGVAFGAMISSISITLVSLDSVTLSIPNSPMLPEWMTPIAAGLSGVAVVVWPWLSNRWYHLPFRVSRGRHAPPVPRSRRRFWLVQAPTVVFAVSTVSLIAEWIIQPR